MSNITNAATAAPSGNQSPSWVRWRILAILLAFSFMSWFNRVSMSVAYNNVLKDKYKITTEAIGWVNTMMLIAYAVCMTPGGWFADRSGAKRSLVFMGFGSALFVAVTGVGGLLAQRAALILAWLLVIRSAMGVCTAPIYPSSGRVIAHWMPFHQRSWANGMITGAALLGISSTFYGFGFILDHVAWPAAFAITGAITAVFALLWTWYGRNDPSEHRGVNQGELRVIRSGAPPAAKKHGPGIGWRTLLRNRSLVLLTFSYAAVGYFEYMTYFWIEYYFVKVLEVGINQSRLYSTIVTLSMAVGMVLGGFLADAFSRQWGVRRGRAAVVVGGLLVGAVLLVPAVLIENRIAIVVLLSLAGAGVGATEGPCWATAIDMGGRRGVGTSAGIFNTGGNVGGQLAPILTPIVSNARSLGWAWGIGLGGIVCLFGAVLWIWIDPGQRTAEQVADAAANE